MIKTGLKLLEGLRGGKIKVKHIEIQPVEGFYAGQRWKATDWDDANFYLRKIAGMAPKGSAYDKTDFLVVFQNDNTYTGRIDIHHTDYEKGGPLDLAKHMREHLQYFVGLESARPSSMSDEKWENHLKRVASDPYFAKLAENYKKWLEKYDVGQG